jgi:hypothetical protein
MYGKLVLTGTWMETFQKAVISKIQGVARGRFIPARRSRSEAGRNIGNKDFPSARLLHLDVGMRITKHEDLSPKGVAAYMVFYGISKSAHKLNRSIRYIIAIFYINKSVFAVCDCIAPFEEHYVNKRLFFTKQVRRKITNKAYVRKDLKA